MQGGGEGMASNMIWIIFFYTDLIRVIEKSVTPLRFGFSSLSLLLRSRLWRI